MAQALMALAMDPPGQSSMSDYMIVGRAQDRDLVQLD